MGIVGYKHVAPLALEREVARRVTAVEQLKAALDALFATSSTAPFKGGKL